MATSSSIPTIERASHQDRSLVAAFCSWFLRPETIIRLVLYLTVLLYLRTIFFDYVYDDIQLLLLNPGMQSWRAIPGFFTHTFWSFLEIPRGIDFYRPLVMLTLALVHHILGPAPGWFHLIAVAIHVLAAYLVYRLACETIGDRTVAGIAAGLFSLHPTKVESVAWISGISDSLSAVFFLGSMVAYFQWKKSGLSRERALSTGLLLLALFSKEAAIFAPVLIAIYEFSAATGSFSDRCKATMRAVWPFALVTAFALATRFILIRTYPERTIEPISPFRTLFTAPRVILWYLEKQLWPLGLSVQYPIRFVYSPSFTRFILPLAVLLIVGGLVVWRIRKSPIGIFFMSWFVVMLAPTVILHRILQEHDRYFYFASVASSIGLAYLISRMRRFGIVTMACSVLAIFALLSAVTFNYGSYWDNDRKLFDRAAQIAPNNPFAADYQASVYSNEHDFQDAEAVAQRLIDGKKYAVEGWRILGSVQFAEGRPEVARDAIQHAVDLSHGYSLAADISLANVDLSLGNNLEAVEIFKRDLEVYPTIAYLHGSLATALSRLGKTEEAQHERELQKHFSTN